jgi:hypothetical protein
MFLTAETPTFGVKGDEIKAYIMAENWLTGTRSNKVRKTPVRVVCWNTLNASDAHVMFELIIQHSRPAMAQLEANLKELIERSTGEYLALKECYELLANTRVTDGKAEEIFSGVYPSIPMPKALQAQAASNPDALDQLAAWERSNGSQIASRNTCLHLFSGEGVGSMTEAARGTAWGVYNAVAEHEQYIKKYRKAESVMFGAGKDRVAESFDLCCAAAGIKEEEVEAIA